MTDYTDFINNFLSGTLSKEQSAEFRKQLLTDENLQEQFTILSSSREYLKAKSTLEEIENDPDLPMAALLVNEYYQEKETSQRKRFKIKRQWIVIISTAAMLVVILFAKSILLSPPNERWYERFYQPLNRLSLEMEINRGASSSHLSAGLESYLKEDYLASFNSFSYEPGSSYYQGISLIGLKEYEEAIEQFEFYLNQSSYHPGANWYLALVYLQKGRYDQAYTHLDKLTKFENPYILPAKKLMSLIHKMWGTAL